MDPRERAVRGFVLRTAAAAAALFAVAAAAGPPALPGPAAEAVPLAVAFVAAAVLAGRFPLHLTERTKLYVDTAVLTAAALSFGVPGAMAVAAGSVAIHQALLRDSFLKAAATT